MRLNAALIASVLCLSGIAHAKIHKVGLKKVPKEDFTVVHPLALSFSVWDT